MPMINISADLNNVKIQDNFTLLPADTYELQLQKDPVLKEFDSQKNPGEKFSMLNFEFTVVNHPDPKINKRKIFHSCGVDGESLGYKTGLKATLVALGGGWDEQGNIDPNVGGPSFFAVVTQKKRKNSTELDNRITEFVGVEMEE
jgi:hypothetical protein